MSRYVESKYMIDCNCIDNELTLVDSDIYVSYGHCRAVMFIIQRALTRR